MGTCHPYMFYEAHPHSVCFDVAGFCCQAVVMVVLVVAEKLHKDVD
jgi:hypothetical protein